MNKSTIARLICRLGLHQRPYKGRETFVCIKCDEWILPGGKRRIRRAKKAFGYKKPY